VIGDETRKTNKEDSDRNKRDISDIPQYQELDNLLVQNLNAIPTYEQLTPSTDVDATDQRLSDRTSYENIGYKLNANESRSSEYEDLQQTELPASDAYESLQPKQ